MKGFLSYLILWNLNKKNMTGTELAKDFEERKGTKPNPGTIYPALKELKGRGLIKSDKNKRYSLTARGKKELNTACKFFCKMFFDMSDMKKKCNIHSTHP